LQPQAQDDAQATYAHKLDKQEAQIDWQHEAGAIVRKIQAFNSWPVAYTHYKGKSLRLWQACLLEHEVHSDVQTNEQQYGEVIAESSEGIDILAKNGVVRIIELQMPGKKRTMVKDFINGQSLMGVNFGTV